MKSCKEVLGFDDTLHKIIGIPLISLLMPAVFYSEINHMRGVPFWQAMLITVVYTVTIWFGSRYIIIRVLDRYPLPAHAGKSILLQLGLLTSYVILVSSAGNLLESYLTQGDMHFQDIGKAIATTLVITITVASIYQGNYLFQLLKKSLVEQERLRRKESEFQLESIRNQINPHFLFNSLNTLASLIPEDAEKSVRYVEDLSSSYRHILDVRDKHVVSLSVELSFTERFINILKHRFEDALQVNIRIAHGDRHQYIIPLALQMLIENAIKHNVATRKQPLRIDITSDGRYVTVSNNLQKRATTEGSTRVGLKNIRDRYAILNGQDIEVSDDGTAFTVRLPLIAISDYKSEEL